MGLQFGFTTSIDSLFLHHALQRVLVFSSMIHNLRYFCFCNFISVHTTLAYAILVHVEHNLGCCLQIHLKKTGQHLDHEFHRSEIVIQQQHAIKAWFFDLWLGFHNDICVIVIAAIVTTVIAFLCAGDAR